MSRADIAPAERRTFHLYADEFQSFATDSFALILSEARKYGLTLTVAHQYLDLSAIRDINGDRVRARCVFHAVGRIARR